VVAEGEVELVGQRDAPHLRLRYKLLCCVHAQQLPRHSDGVQCDEECVPAPHQQIRDEVDDVEGVVEVSDDLGDRPGQQS